MGRKGEWAGTNRRAGAGGRVLGGVFSWAGLISAACSSGWISLAGEFKLGYSHCHSLNITFIF